MVTQHAQATAKLSPAARREGPQSLVTTTRSRTLAPSSSLRPATTTSYPRRARSRAVAAPIPDVAPVTRATLRLAMLAGAGMARLLAAVAGRAAASGRRGGREGGAERAARRPGRSGRERTGGMLFPVAFC